MKRAVIGLFLLLVLPSAGQAQDLWRGMGADGELRYSDRPFAGAKRVDLHAAGRWSGRPTANEESGPVESRTVEVAQGEGPQLAITSPAPGETIWGAGGELEVVLDISGELEEGSRMVLELDGAEADWEGELPVVRLKQVWRGEHGLRARLMDSRGRELSSSGEVRFYKRQHSVMRPAG